MQRVSFLVKRLSLLEMMQCRIRSEAKTSVHLVNLLGKGKSKHSVSKNRLRSLDKGESMWGNPFGEFIE